MNRSRKAEALASRGRWPPSVRRFPQSDSWKAVVVLIRRFSECFGTAKLLMDVALGRVKECPFPNEAVRELKDEVVQVLSSRGLQLKRESGDRDELPIDFRFLDLLLRAAKDPDTQLGAFAQGVPRHPALYRLESQWDPTNWQEEEMQSEYPWRQNYASLVGFADKVEAVLEDQVGRGQVLKFTEAEAGARFPDLVVASLGAQRKDKPDGVVSARVLFDGTHGLAVNTRTRIRDQERSPIAADLERAMKEKAELDQPTFALTADVSLHFFFMVLHCCEDDGTGPPRPSWSIPGPHSLRPVQKRLRFDVSLGGQGLLVDSSGRRTSSLLFLLRYISPLSLTVRASLLRVATLRAVLRVLGPSWWTPAGGRQLAWRVSRQIV